MAKFHLLEGFAKGISKSKNKWVIAAKTAKYLNLEWKIPQSKK